jgi:outer membrane protein assembly factor BamB
MTLLLALVLNVSEDWPQWRGPNRDAVSQTAIAKWPDKLVPKWKIDIGEGHSSPVFAAGRIYSFARQNELEIVRALDPTTGKQLWQQSYASPYDMSPPAVSHGKGPKSTPLFADGKLYTFGINGMLACWDAATGKRVWRHDFKTSPEFGTAMSPILHAGSLIVHGGASRLGAMMAFNAATGNVKWMWKGDGAAYASPVIATVAGKAQLITQTEKHVAAIDPADGQLLWKIPFATAYDQNSVTPVVRGDMLIYSGLDNGITAVRLTAKGPEQLWQNKAVAMYMNSPVWQGELLCGLSHKNKGQYFCLNSTTGKTLWTSPGRQGENAAMILAKNQIVSLDVDGQLHVIALQDKAFQEIKKLEAAKSATWAHPALVPGGILIKDFSSLTFYPL